jgi:3-dehydroquinate synthase
MNNIITQLLENRFSRNSHLVALGGGVVGDITGFAAACYQRGINYIQIPTTLLAQVDSSVGGKTAVNHEFGKNMIGAFHQPIAVYADSEVLNTLPDRELTAGLAEIIKYGLIRDKEFFIWLEENMLSLMERDADSLQYAIEHSCLNKAEVVAEDEKEQGQRALLNFGHTFGHAIETGMNYKDWLHGEAVGLGMLMAADLSCRTGWITEKELKRVQDIMAKAGLPLVLPEQLLHTSIRDLMSIDKKAKDGKLFLVLLKGIGNAVVTSEFDEKLLQLTLEQYSSTEGMS